MQIEEWRDIPSMPYYQASNLGNIRSLPRVIMKSDGKPQTIKGGVMKAVPAPLGYKYISSKGRTKLVHRLVMEAFVGPSELQVNHIDEDKGNNVLTNLEYVTSYENITYRQKRNMPTGVYFKDNLYCAQISIGGKDKSLGYYRCPDEAHQAYLNALKENGLKNKYARNRQEATALYLKQQALSRTGDKP